MFTRCEIRCAICGENMDYHHAYGRGAACCSKRCHGEFEWRRVLSILGHPYRPDPRKLPPPVEQAAEVGGSGRRDES